MWISLLLTFVAVALLGKSFTRGGIDGLFFSSRDQLRTPTTQEQSNQLFSSLTDQSQDVIVTSDESTFEQTSFDGQRPEEGVQVSRTITKLMPDAAIYMQVVEDLDNKAEDPCTNHDVYGANDCHLQWSSVVTVNYTVQVNSTIVEGDTLEGHFTLDRFLPWKFSCPLCGKDCELQFPILPLNYTIVMPPCPIPPHSVSHILEHHLWEHSPTEGVVTTHLEGTVHLFRGSTQESIAEFSVTVTVR